jgi:uracil permease
MQSLTNSWSSSGDFSGVDWLGVLTGVVALLATSFFTVVLRKGFISQVPILLGVLFGMAFSYLVWVPLVAGGYDAYLSGISQTSVLGLMDVMPWVTIPAAINNLALIGVAVVAIFPIAFATIPESAAHVNQIDLYVNQLSSEKGGSIYPIKEMLGENLVGDGAGDIVAVVLGGPAGTNYGENISTSAITKNFSSAVFFFTSLLAIAVGLILEALGLGNLSLIITNPVVQGVSIYLFGAIAVQGIALMISKKVDIFDPKVVSVMAFIAIVGLGVNSVILSPELMLPGIGIAAVGGILLNLLLSLFDKKKAATPEVKVNQEYSDQVRKEKISEFADELRTASKLQEFTEPKKD